MRGGRRRPVQKRSLGRDVLADGHGARIVQESAQVKPQIFRALVEHRRKIKPGGSGGRLRGCSHSFRPGLKSVKKLGRTAEKQLEQQTIFLRCALMHVWILTE